MVKLFPPIGWAGYQRHRAEIAELLDPRCYEINWLDVEILNGRVLCLDNDEAVIAFKIEQYPAGAKELHGMVAAGALRAILELIDQAEALAREIGVEFAVIASRPGWARVLRDHGYDTHQIMVRKELCHGA
jgi:hypothetical protein